MWRENMKLHLDFETRSPVDLVTCGAYLYAAQAEIICMAWAIDDEPVQVWKPLEGEPFPPRVHRAIRDNADCYAHNAEFEAAIFNALLPAYAPEEWQWICTANLAAACALPRALGPLAQCMGLRARKDIAAMLGTRVYLELHVSVVDRWTENARILREQGIE